MKYTISSMICGTGNSCRVPDQDSLIATCAQKWPHRQHDARRESQRVLGQDSLDRHVNPEMAAYGAVEVGIQVWDKGCQAPDPPNSN